MVKARGRILPVIGVVLLVAFVGVKMASKGWVKLDHIKDQAKAQQPGGNTPMEWPPKLAATDDALCHTVKLNTAQVNKAMEDGIAIDPQRRCITKISMAEFTAAQARWAKAQQQRESLQVEQEALNQAVEQQIATGGITLQNLSQARAGKETKAASALLPMPQKASTPLPSPPADLFVPIGYQSGDLKLTAFVTPNPGGQKKQPLMVWITGGDSNSLDDFWSEGPAANDQSASAFRKAGMVMLFPTLRGGNTNPGKHEYFWGEVQDIAAAMLEAVKLPYVDASRIYLGGHSTGGTLALLAATAGLPIQGVFAFGPVADVSSYPPQIVPLQWSRLDPFEKRMRAPVYWLHAVKSPTWIIEGNKAPSNSRDQDALCAARKSQQVHCVSVKGADHFSVLQPLTRRIASQLAMGQEVQLDSNFILQ